MIEIERIEAFSNQIFSRFQPNRIILFGSYANGNPTEDSDVDLLLIMPFTGYSFRKAAEILVATDPDFAVDLLVRTPEDIEHRLALGDPFIQAILERGKILHKK